MRSDFTFSFSRLPMVLLYIQGPQRKFQKMNIKKFYKTDKIYTKISTFSLILKSITCQQAYKDLLLLYLSKLLSIYELGQLTFMDIFKFLGIPIVLHLSTIKHLSVHQVQILFDPLLKQHKHCCRQRKSMTKSLPSRSNRRDKKHHNRNSIHGITSLSRNTFIRSVHYRGNTLIMRT